MADDITIYDSGNWPTQPPTIQVGQGSRAGSTIFTTDLESIIWFTDPVVLAAAIAALGGDRVYMSPVHARALFNISTSAPYIPGVGPAPDQDDPDNTIWIEYGGYSRLPTTHRYEPIIGGQWTVQRIASINTLCLPFGFDPADLPFYDETHDWFVVNGWTSVALSGLPYPPYCYQWCFELRQQGGAFTQSNPNPPAPAAIAQRRWVDGFELPEDGEGGISNTLAFSKVASRTIDGLGFAYRGIPNQSRDHSLADLGAAASHDSWERIYVRTLVHPTGASDAFYAINGSVSAGNVNFLRISPAGLLEFTEGAGQTVIASTGAPFLGSFVKLDLFIHYSTGGGNPGTFQVYYNRVLVLDVSTVTAFGIGQNQNHARSRLGSFTGATNGLEFDADDWFNAELPGALTGMDWLMGSHMQLIRATGFGAGHQAAAWTGSYRAALQNPIENATTIATLVSTTVSAIAQFDTDLHDAQLTEAQGTVVVSGAARQLQNGAAAIAVAFFCSDTAAGSVTITLTGLGGTASLTIAIGTIGWITALFRPVGQLRPLAMEPLTIQLQSSPSAGTTTIQGAFAVAEDLGIFGDEDYGVDVSPAPPPPPASTGIHNAPYPRSPWALVGGMPAASIFVAYGLYTGNGPSGQDYGLPYPPCWLYVRPLTAGTDGVRWWSTLLTSHQGLRQGLNAALMPQALLDPTVGDGSSLLRTTGSETQGNAAAVVYQYVAMCDPGQRFITNGALARPATIPAATAPLANSAFTPEAGFFNIENLGTTTTPDLYYKGIGHAAANAQKLSTAEVANVATFGAGQLDTQTLLHQASVSARPQTAYSLWRRSDGLPSNPSQGVVVHLGSYVGDGAASRVIPCTLGGRFPSYAQVSPHNAVSFVRDPSHTGTTSSNANNMTTTSATAITAGGIDSITVGITLNALGIIYDVFVLPSCSTTGWDNNGGDFCPLNYGGYVDNPSPPYIPDIPEIPGGEDLCVDDWGTPRADGLPYVPLMPGATQDDHQ